jgi:putative toxin-antitoxin system antitoxin component (TIGR02293 family)
MVTEPLPLAFIDLAQACRHMHNSPVAFGDTSPRHTKALRQKDGTKVISDKSDIRKTSSTSMIITSQGSEYEVISEGQTLHFDFSYAAISQGIQATVARDLQRCSVLTKLDLARVISVRTLERRLQRTEPLKPEEADGLARLVRVTAHAFRVFEDEDLAEEWLRSPNPALNDEVPMEMASTDVGAREVEGVLTRLENGIFD